MKHLLRLAWVPIVAACKDDPDCPGATDAPVLTDANNYSFSGSIDIGADQVTARVDATIDWSALTEDFQGHALDPATGVDQLALIVFRYLDQDQVIEAISTDTLQQSDISLYVQHLNTDEDTECLVSEFSIFGNDIDIETYFSETYGTWLLLLGEGTLPGQGTLMMSFVEPLKGGTETRVEVTNDSASVNFDVDMQGLDPVAVPSGTPITVDWSSVGTDGRGNALDLGDVDQLWVAHYPDVTTTELQADFFDLEFMTEEIWTADVGGLTDYALADMEGPSTLSGLSTDGTWLLALRCSTCFNPAPPFLTELCVQ